MIAYLNSLDTKLFLYLNDFHSSFFDIVMYYISTKLIWIPLYLVLLFLIFKKFGAELFYILLAIIILVVLTDQFSGFIKDSVHRFRPCHNASIDQWVHIVRNKCGGKYGFVSSHAANTFGIATFMYFLFRKKVFAVLIFLWAIVVSYSRIYLGVHYPGDVIGGAIVGISSAWFVYYLLREIDQKVLKRKIGLE